MLKKCPSDKINVTKNVLFFLLQDPIHHSFTFIFHLSKTVCGVFHFQFRLVFIKLLIFVQQKAWTR